MMMGGPVLGAILFLGALAFSTPVLAADGSKESDVQGIKQQLMSKLQELFLKHLADERRETGGDALTRILFRQHNGISSRSTATALTLSLPTLSAPPRSVRICLQGPRQCYSVNRDRSRAGADRAEWNYTLHLNRTTLLTDVRVQFHAKGFRMAPGLAPTLEVRLGTGSARRTGVVLRQLGRSRRLRRDAALNDPSPGWNQGLCGLHSWVFNSSLLKTSFDSTWPGIQITYPPVLQVDYCAGQCTEFANMTENARARQRHRHLHGSGVGPPPAICVPDAYRTVTIIIQYGAIRKNLPLDRFTATGCICH